MVGQIQDETLKLEPLVLLLPLDVFLLQRSTALKPGHLEHFVRLEIGLRVVWVRLLQDSAHKSLVGIITHHQELLGSQSAGS